MNSNESNTKKEKIIILKELLDEMETLENEFVVSPTVSALPSCEIIYSNEKFLLWRSKVECELDGETDILSKSILEQLTKFNGWKDRNLFNIIKSELTVLVKNQENNSDTTINQISSEQEIENKLFISHSSLDKEYMIALSEMLEGIGMPDGSFVCSSVPGHGIPGGNKTYEWLRDQFLNCKLRVLFVLSDNYYKSAACLNEMGAAWITKATYSLLLLPKFDFKDIKGCIDSTQIGISFNQDDDELNHRLNEFKDTIISEHHLPNISQARWDREKTNFIKVVRNIAERTKEETAELIDNKEEEYKSIEEEDNVGYIPVDSAFLLVYASEYGGYITKISDIDGAPPYILVNNNIRFMKDFSHRESAKWQAALNRLLKWGWVKQSDNSKELYELTGKGYEKADMLKEGMRIDITKEPIEELPEYET